MSQKILKHVQQTCLEILVKSDRVLRERSYTDDDIRKTFYGKTNGVILSGFLNVIYLHTQLSYPEWWNATFQGKLAALAKNGREAMNCFEGQARKSLLLSSVSVTESTMRAICRAISPGSCSNGLAEFKSVYDHVLSKLCITPNSPVLDLARNMRNAILHNDGIYMNPRKERETIEYRGKEYVFDRNIPVRGLDWLLLCNIITDMFDLMNQVIQTDTVSSVDKIEDIQKIELAQQCN